MTRYEIQVLRAAGIPERVVANRTAASVRSVERISHEPPVTGPIRTVRVGRPALTGAWADQVAAWLTEDHALPGMEILRRAHEAGYAGGKSARYELIRRLRPTPTLPVVRFEGVPGEFSHHDFGQADVRYGDGRTERVHFFASRLKWSRTVDVRLVPNEQEEALVRALLRSFEAFGGIPLVTVWDNPKTVVQQKGAVEQLVGWVKRSFFTGSSAASLPAGASTIAPISSASSRPGSSTSTRCGRVARRASSQRFVWPTSVPACDRCPSRPVRTR